MNDIQKITTQLTHTTSAPSEAIELVVNRLPEITKKTEAFGKSNSQTTLNMMTLTMMNGQSPMRQIRQILAEVEKRQSALAEAQVSHAKLEKEISTFSDSENDTVLIAEDRQKQFQLMNLEAKIGGSIKDIATLIGAYDRLIQQHGLAEWSEEEFEKSECKHHVRRGFELLYHNMVEVGRPKTATIEYLQQFGVHVQVATHEVAGYMKVTEDLIKNGTIPTASHLEDFLDHMSDKYEHCVKESALRMFGVEDVTNPDFMTTWKK